MQYEIKYQFKLDKSLFIQSARFKKIIIKGYSKTKVSKLKEYDCYNNAFSYMMTTETGPSNSYSQRCNCLHPCNYVTYNYKLTDKF